MPRTRPPRRFIIDAYCTEKPRYRACVIRISGAQTNELLDLKREFEAHRERNPRLKAHAYEKPGFEISEVAYPDGSPVTPPTGIILLSNYRDVADADIPRLIHTSTFVDQHLTLDPFGVIFHWDEKFVPNQPTASFAARISWDFFEYEETWITT